MKPNPAPSEAAGGRLLTAADWLQHARRVVESKMPAGADAAGSGDTRLAIQLLLAHALGRPRTWIIAHPEAQITALQAARSDALLAQFADGVPLPCLLGRWEFYGRSFIVTPDTLIPRPETELLVDEAAAWLRRHPDRRRAVDVGTGSGCIAVSLAKSIPDLRVLAADRSFAALRVARQNAQEHGCAGQIDFLNGDLLRSAAGPFDLVCANLPYIPTADLAALDQNLAAGVRAARSRDIPMLMALDREFHGAISAAAGNPVLGEILRNLHDRAQRVWFVSRRAAEHHHRVVDEHGAIVDALKQQDPEGAEAAARAHVRSFAANLTRQL